MDKLTLHELNEVLEIEKEKDKKRFAIETTEQLSWAFRKIKAINTQLKEVEFLAKTEIQRIEQWRDKEVESLESNKQFFEGLIEEYAVNKRTENPEFKSQKTPFGRVGYKKQQVKWKYDDKKLVEYLKNTGKNLYIHVEEKPKKNEIKKAFKVSGNHVIDESTGEIIDGIKILPQEEKIDIKAE